MRKSFCAIMMMTLAVGFGAATAGAQEFTSATACEAGQAWDAKAARCVSCKSLVTDDNGLKSCLACKAGTAFDTKAIRCVRVTVGGQGPSMPILEVARICSADARRLCAGVLPGGGRIIACIRENVAQVSPRCQEALQGTSGEPGDDQFDTIEAGAQQDNLGDQIVQSLTADRPVQMSAFEIQTQQSTESLLNDLPKLTSIDPAIMDRVRRRISLRYVPTVDLAVYFEYDSAEITDRASRTLDILGRALNRPVLGGSTIVLAGHTDATGSFEYNRDLSQRRAAAVKAYLVSQSRIPPALLINVGVGELFLKDKQNPASAINRRVQIINLGR